MPATETTEPTTAAHTPGPWQVNDHRPTEVVGVEWAPGVRRLVADCRTGRDRQAEDAANARAIAALPDLLAVVESLAMWDARNPKGRVFPVGPNDVEKQHDAITDAARAALVKATGRQP